VGLRPVRKLEREDDHSAFECSKPELDEWLRKYAFADQQSNSSVTWVLTRDEKGVIGYYTLAPQSIDPRHGDPGRLGKGLPTERPIPVYLLARLALDASEHGQSLGADLLRDALARCAAGAESFGGRAVLVHAKDDEAARFYEHHGFVAMEENPRSLHLLMKDIKQSLAESV